MVEAQASVGSSGIVIPVPGSRTMQFYVAPPDVLDTHIQDLIGNRFIMKRGNTEREREETTLTDNATCEQLEGLKYVGLFFSMGNCAPCKMMLQNLKNFYTDVNLEERKFEIILVSSDETQEEFDSHFSQMPWMALNLDDTRNNQIRDKFQILGVPALIILDAKTGFPVTTRARKDLKKDVKEVFESWDKLLELKKQRTVERAEEDAIAMAQLREREDIEKLKKKAAEQGAQDGAGVVQADI